MKRSLRSFTRILTALVALAMTLVLRPQPAVADDGAQQVVRQLTDKVIGVLQDKSASAEAKRGKIRDIVIDYIDFETMSQLTLARNWKPLSDDQKQQFVQEFKEHLAVTYGRNVESYNNEKVQITGDRDAGRGDWIVTTKILRPAGGGDILVDYRLRKKDGTWKVIDLVIERVSLVSNFRSQFQEIMANGGIDKLLKQLHEKNAAGQTLKK